MDSQDRDIHEIPIDDHPVSHAAKSDDQGMLTVRPLRPQSYEQRRHIEKNREHIDPYHTAGVIHGYRHSAKDARSAQQAVRSVATGPMAPQRISTLAQTASARTRKHGGYHSSPFARNQTGDAPAPNVPATGAPKVPKKSFSEPQTRKYNPYG